MRNMEVPTSAKITESTTTLLPEQRAMKTPSPLKKRGGRSRIGGGGNILSNLGMQLSGSVAVLVVILLCLIYSYWDSHRLHHLLDTHEEFIVTVDRVVDGDTFVGTVEDTYVDANDDDDVEAVPMGSVVGGVDDGVCVPVACERRQRNQPELGISAQELNCCRRKPRLVVRGGLTAWFRLRRIDAPEMTGVGGEGGGGQPFSLEAKRTLEGLLLQGTPLLPSAHTANSMMLQAAHRLDNPIIASTPTATSAAPKTMMSRTDLAKSQFITLPIWKSNVDHNEQPSSSSSSSNTRSTPSNQRQPSSSFSSTTSTSTVTVSVRIVEQDRSGRYVVDAFVQPSPLGNIKARLWASYEMVRAGYAWGYSSSTPSPSFSTPTRPQEGNLDHQEEEDVRPITVSVAEAFMDPLVVAMQAAKNEGRGLWGGGGEQPQSVIVEPWRWRILSVNKKKSNNENNNNDGGASTAQHHHRSHQSNNQLPNQDRKAHDLASTGGRQNERRNSNNRRHRHKFSS